MSGALVIGLGLASIGLLVMAVITWYEVQTTRAEETAARATASRRPATIAWPTLASHAAPEEPLTVSSAHKAMQIHLECSIDLCGHKSAAHRTLVEAGHIKPRLEYQR